MGSHGIEVLVQLQRTVPAADARLRLAVGDAAPVRRPLHALGLDGVFALYDTVADALDRSRLPMPAGR